MGHLIHTEGRKEVRSASKVLGTYPPACSRFAESKKTPELREKGDRVKGTQEEEEKIGGGRRVLRSLCRSTTLIKIASLTKMPPRSIGCGCSRSHESS